MRPVFSSRGQNVIEYILLVMAVSIVLITVILKKPSAGVCVTKSGVTCAGLPDDICNAIPGCYWDDCGPGGHGACCGDVPLCGGIMPDACGQYAAACKLEAHATGVFVKTTDQVLGFTENLVQKQNADMVFSGGNQGCVSGGCNWASCGVLTKDNCNHDCMGTKCGVSPDPFWCETSSGAQCTSSMTSATCTCGFP